MIGSLENNYRGYLSLFMLLVGLRSISHAFVSNKLNWVPDYIAVGPGPVILVSPAGSSNKECGEISADECLKKLQTFLKLTSLPFTSDKNQLDNLCSNLVEGYNCSTQKMALPNCLSAKDKRLVPVFIDMAQYTMFMFCSSGDGENGYLREALFQNSDCILKQKGALDCCAEQSKLPELPVMHILEESGRSLAERQIAACCPVSNYLRCVRNAMVNTCGGVSGNLTTEYIRRASGEEMEAVCQKMPNYPELDEGVCKTSVPVCSGATCALFAELTALMSFLFVSWINNQRYSVM